jgi:hypothetical protein
MYHVGNFISHVARSSGAVRAPQYIASPMVALFSRRAERREGGFPFFFGETSLSDGVFREIDIPFDISRFYPSRFSEQRTRNARFSSVRRLLSLLAATQQDRYKISIFLLSLLLRVRVVPQSTAA